MTIVDRILDALIFGRPSRVLAVLAPFGLLGWLGIYALGGWWLVGAIAVAGLIGMVSLAAWIMGDLSKLWGCR